MGKSTIKNTRISMDAPHTISVLGHIVEIIHPKAVTAHDLLSVDEMQEINLTGTTWAVGFAATLTDRRTLETG
jgi:hypothetical protein